MEITIKLTDSDLVNADPVNLQAFILMIQSFKKSIVLDDKNIFREAVNKQVEENKKNSSKVEEKVSAEKSFDRKEIEAEIKKSYADKKELQPIIKEFLNQNGAKKLSEVPDEKIIELLEKVRGIE